MSKLNDVYDSKFASVSSAVNFQFDERSVARAVGSAWKDSKVKGERSWRLRMHRLSLCNFCYLFIWCLQPSNHPSLYA